MQVRASVTCAVGEPPIGKLARMTTSHVDAPDLAGQTDADRPAAIPDGGYRLVLEGRMAAFADGRAVRCRAAGPDHETTVSEAPSGPPAATVDGPPDEVADSDRLVAAAMRDRYGDRFASEYRRISRGGNRA